ncbi:hypothetical protein PR002_g11663, partial [Phytophthora rubi]
GALWQECGVLRAAADIDFGAEGPLGQEPGRVVRESDSSDEPERILRRLLGDYERIRTRPLRKNQTEADR